MNALKSNKELDINRLVFHMSDKGYTGFFTFEEIVITEANGEKFNEMGIAITFKIKNNKNSYNMFKKDNFQLIFLKDKKSNWNYKLVQFNSTREYIPEYLIRNLNLFPILPLDFVIKQKIKMYELEPQQKRKVLSSIFSLIEK